MKRFQLLHVFLNGEAAPPALPYREGDGVWVADGGMRHAQAFEFPVDLWLGDFDSSRFNPSLTKAWQRFPSDKDETDWELILKRTDEAKFLVLNGFWGGELDHQWSNLWALAGSQRQALIAAPTQNILCLTAPFRLEALLPLSSRLSISALQPIEALHGEGLRWPWLGEALPPHVARGCRNETVSERVMLQAQTGQALIFLPRTAHLQSLHTAAYFWEALCF